jgi:HNH endonuclease
VVQGATARQAVRAWRWRRRMSAPMPDRLEVCAREIPLTRGFVALVDAEDYDRVVAEGSWYATSHGHLVYACRKDSAITYMHRFVLGAPATSQVDHRDRDGLNNRRTNLRLSTCAQNAHNTGAMRGSTSSYKGVHWSRVGQGWLAQIRTGDARRLTLGYFHTEYGAALAYDRAARRFFGEFAFLNIHELPATLDVRAVPRTGDMGPGKFSRPRDGWRLNSSPPLAADSICTACSTPLFGHDGEGNCR